MRNVSIAIRNLHNVPCEVASRIRWSVLTSGLREESLNHAFCRVCDYMVAHQLADLTCHAGAGFNRRVNAAHITADDRRDQTSPNFDAFHHLDVGGFHHGVSRGHQSDQAFCFDQSNRFHTITYAFVGGQL